MKNTVAAGAFVLALASSAAQASTYNVDFSGTLSANYSFDVMATVTTGASAGNGGFDITAITGTDSVFNSGTNTTSSYSITGLVGVTSSTPPAQGTYYASNGLGWYYNDVLYPTSTPYVDINGPLFADSSGNVLNLYSNGGTYYLSVDNPGGTLWDPGDPGTLGVSATPLPPSWAMMIPGLIGLGFFAYRGKRNRAGLGNLHKSISGVSA